MRIIDKNIQPQFLDRYPDNHKSINKSHLVDYLGLGCLSIQGQVFLARYVTDPHHGVFVQTGIAVGFESELGFLVSDFG